MPCAGKPFLAWQMREMQRFGVEEFIFLTEQDPPDVTAAIEALQSFLPKPAGIFLSATPRGHGTGGALLQIRPYLPKRFLLCHGNALFSCNLARFLGTASGGHWRLLQDVKKLEQQQDRGKFIPAQAATEACGTGEATSTGIYLFDVSIFDNLTETCSLEQDVLRALVQGDVLRSIALPGYFCRAMDPESLGVAEKEFPQVLRRPAVFLDRDGVINRDFGWVGTRERFEWEAGAREAIARITESGYHVFIVTNQSGVARGFYSEDDLLQLMDWVIDVIRDDGGTVDDWRYCPMHPDAKIEQYRGSSINRKPAPGMIVDLLQRWELDPARCVLFGDQPSDMQAARAAGVRGVPIGPDSLADLVSEMDIFSI
nr:HAD-IIIA family hydrolase [Gluconobacter sp. Dm-62]